MSIILTVKLTVVFGAAHTFESMPALSRYFNTLFALATFVLILAVIVAVSPGTARLEITISPSGSTCTCSLSVSNSI